MKAVYITRHGRPEVLRYEDRPDPTPGRGEMLIAVQAAGVNFGDLLQRMGLYPERYSLPYIPGYEAAGVVEAVGEGVREWHPGDRAVAMMQQGGYATKIAIRADRAIRIPDGISFEDAAAIPVNYVTAYHMIVRLGNLQHGERILIHAAAGGVGIAAVQLARNVGAEILGTASASKHVFLQAQGVDHPIDYRSKDFVQEARRITQGKGLHMILDPLGGAATADNYDLLAPGGRLIFFGSFRIAGRGKRGLGTIIEFLRLPRFGAYRLFRENRAVFGVYMTPLFRDETWPILEEELRILFRLHSEGIIRPVVSKTFPLDHAADAHRFMHDRENVGKVLLIPPR